MHQLVEISKKRFYGLKDATKKYRFTGEEEIDSCLNNLEKYSHLYVLSCLMDRGIKAEKAWKIPYLLCKYFNAFDMESLSQISYENIREWFLKFKPHRYNEDMAQVFFDGVQKIHNDYNDDISQVWKNKPSSASVIYKFLQFKGCGIKIATMATNILVREYNIELSDYYSIDISPDVHIKRIMYRLGLILNQEDINLVLYKARELYPEFPGIIDRLCWEIGRNFCHPTNPDCSHCILRSGCKYNK